MGEIPPKLPAHINPPFTPTLPAELWNQIFEYVVYVRGIMDSYTPDPFDVPGCRLPHQKFPMKEYRASLVYKRSLVLVCKRWNILAMPLLYQVVVLGPRNIGPLYRTIKHSERHLYLSTAMSTLGSFVRHIELNTLDRVHDIVGILRCTYRLEIFSVDCLLYDAHILPTPLVVALTSACHSTLRRLSFRGAYPDSSDCLDIIRSCQYLQTTFLANPDVGYGFCPVEVLKSPHVTFLSVGHNISDPRSNASVPDVVLQAPPSVQGHFLLSSKFSIPLEDWSLLLARHGHRFRTIYLEMHDADRDVQKCLDIFSANCPNLQHFILVTLNFRRLAAALPYSFPPTITHLGLYAKQEGSFFTLFSALAELGEETTPLTPRLQVLRLLNPSASDVLRGEGLMGSFGPLVRSLPFRVQDHDGQEMLSEPWQ
ncbi:hypothetical protein EVG20_g1360 [Dentipellis fragilis]|uniref:F-box domain-containing protein n=1 Tax=Dentipellis fragilis TaxID=205917 RepID=A0A4Y9ZBX5_9AGAM|nr:hypothetical protein EVG20_g1360 [Dentipellis fragilis]